MNFRLCAPLVLAALVAVGCSNVNPELSKPTKVVTWPELQALQSPDVSMGIFRPMQMNDFKTMKAALADPKIEDLVNKLAESKIPSEFASKEREDAKTKVVEQYKLLISSAKGMGGGSELKRAGTELQTLLGKLTDPNLK